jgi:hypothetical protein
MSATPRNSPCPCGSGTKFKRCCLGRIERARHAHREHDRVGRDVVAWASEQHGESLDRLLSPSWPDRSRYRGRAATGANGALGWRRTTRRHRKLGWSADVEGLAPPLARAA